MRKTKRITTLILAVFCLLTLTIGAGAAETTTITDMKTDCLIDAGGSCQITQTVTVDIAGTENTLELPLAAGAKRISVAGYKYKKTTQDDLINMKTGLFGYKGRVHFQVAPCLNDELLRMDRSLPKPELFARISASIDRRIHSNYRIYSGNYVAYDWLNGSTTFAANYTEEEKLRFTNYIDQQLAKINIPNKDEDFLREKLLLMYSNPLVNYLAACR